MEIRIVENGITDIDVDAIVNAANSGLAAGSGVCGAIFRAAGHDELAAACRAIGNCATGSAVITPGYRTRADFIIHAVGPVWSGSSKDEEQLFSCYKRSLELARDNRCASIAFPVISSGIFGYPFDQAFATAIRGIRSFFEENPDSNIEVFFTIPDDARRKEAQSIYDQMQ